MYWRVEIYRPHPPPDGFQDPWRNEKRTGHSEDAVQDRATNLEKDFFRKRSHQEGTVERKEMIDRKSRISFKRQCELLKLP